MPRLHSSSDAAMEPNSLPQRIRSLLNERIAAVNDLTYQYKEWFHNQPTHARILLALGGVLLSFVAILLIIFHRYAIHILVQVSDYWEHLTYGRSILFVLVFFVGFPPLLGFSPLSLLSGMVYGFPNAWPLLSTASVLGSLASFLVFRHLLRNRAERYVQSNEKFRAFAEILKEDASLLVLVLLRLCPLPYSLSNGALAAIPQLPTLTYFLASVITTPKLFIHVYVGHTIKNLGDDQRPFSAKVIDVISVLLTGLALGLASYIIYNKMQAKLQSYHMDRNANDDMIFGNFDDDLESGQDLELDSHDFDEDNFIITDDDDTNDAASQSKSSKSTEYSKTDDIDNADLFADQRGYRDH